MKRLMHELGLMWKYEPFATVFIGALIAGCIIGPIWALIQVMK